MWHGFLQNHPALDTDKSFPPWKEALFADAENAYAS
jgi:hypothetical protein